MKFCQWSGCTDANNCNTQTQSAVPRDWGLWEDVQDIVGYQFEEDDLRELKSKFTIQRRKQ